MKSLFTTLLLAPLAVLHAAALSPKPNILIILANDYLGIA